MTDRLTVYAPLRMEATRLRDALGDDTVVRSGAGPRRAAQAQRPAGRDGPVAVAGIGGGLVADLSAG
ncbi:MAG TPA: hypothetical protein VF053_06400, partial [Streptosporangiales bacterium]